MSVGIEFYLESERLDPRAELSEVSMYRWFTTTYRDSFEESLSGLEEVEEFFFFFTRDLELRYTLREDEVRIVAVATSEIASESKNNTCNVSRIIYEREAVESGDEHN